MMSEKITILDGGFGTMLQLAGLPPGKDPLDWNLENPQEVVRIHREYREAGAEIISANTFGANELKYAGAHDLETLVRLGVENAREALGGNGGKVALDLGPTGRMLKPAGDLDFIDAYEAFSRTVRVGVGAGADLVFIETMGDLRELKAAVLAAKDNCDLPVYASVALQSDGKLLTGADIECVSVLLESLQVDALGLNCGVGPDKMLSAVERLSAISARPIIVKPNAGIPEIVGGKTTFNVGPELFAGQTVRLARAGARFVGGCCGTTPSHIKALSEALKREGGDIPPLRRQAAARTVVCGSAGTVELKSGEGLIIGERINPTGKRLLREAYLKGDVAYVLREAVSQTEAGAQILDINCGVPGIDETATLASTVESVQSVVSCPIEVDTSDPEALASALPLVNGKALINSVNGKRESMDVVFPAVKRYGGVMVALCLDEDGIPSTAEGRVAIAERILEEGAKYGFTRSDFVFDALTLAVSADPSAAKVTLETVRRLTEELKVNTVLGVSNVSFALPGRRRLNNAMYSLAKRAGLSAAIANPAVIADEMDDAAVDVLMGRDANCERWIALNADIPEVKVPAPTKLPTLREAIMAGLKADAKAAAERELSGCGDAMEVVQREIVPALEEVGRGFERGKVFLPQLLMAADASGAAFEAVSAAYAANGSSVKRGAPIVLATVKGDIHDIGKNIVRSLLENYGFDVIDLGRDVEPEKIIEAAVRSKAMMVGLSALMTTTVGAMERTIALMKERNVPCPVVVGGAVVTAAYAETIGADFYAADAMKTVRIAESLL